MVHSLSLAYLQVKRNFKVSGEALDVVTSPSSIGEVNELSWDGQRMGQPFALSSKGFFKYQRKYLVLLAQSGSAAGPHDPPVEGAGRHRPTETRRVLKMLLSSRKIPRMVGMMILQLTAR
jgi:hypothetical protein